MSADIRLLRWPDRDRDEYERLAAALVRVRAIAALPLPAPKVIVPRHRRETTRPVVPRRE